ncbi:hypothetical protein TUM19329_17480 [Legionella antarctica]|uniref:SGNH domain-containing protein n=1 Tax=Legionella antarctica TaxID=2708020 RepID=A0A6F8T5F6_9GAMM|nr:SGNH hydrolase domain-containing protein [Legionella antarctica]BCA95387.1 hypothetical protein TUM19329_17480 [Legionella antarctica]
MSRKPRLYYSEEPVKKHIEKSLDHALRIIIASGSIPVLIKSIQLGVNSRDCFFDHIKRRGKYNPELCEFSISLKEQQWQNDLFLRMKNKYAQLVIIEPKKVQCPRGRCTADINGVPVFRDTEHITDYASYQFARIYLQHYQNPLKG